MKYARGPAVVIEAGEVLNGLSGNPEPNECGDDAIHVVWTVPLGDSASIANLYSSLVCGQESRLFGIRSWDCRDGQVSAILEPQAPFEDIVAILWSTGREPAALWLENREHTDSRPTN